MSNVNLKKPLRTLSPDGIRLRLHVLGSLFLTGDGVCFFFVGDFLYGLGVSGAYSLPSFRVGVRGILVLV